MNLPIYIVSLKRDIERRNKINDVFYRLNINFDFFDAIDAKDPQNKEIIENNVAIFKEEIDNNDVYIEKVEDSKLIIELTKKLKAEL